MKNYREVADVQGLVQEDPALCAQVHFLDGDDEGIVEIIRDYKDGLILYLNGFTRNISTALLFKL